jgi:hypothetical protein
MTAYICLMRSDCNDSVGHVAKEMIRGRDGTSPREEKLVDQCMIEMMILGHIKDLTQVRCHVKGRDLQIEVDSVRLR